MANTYLKVSTSSSGTRTKWTASFWVKRSSTGSEHTVYGSYLDNNNKDKIAFDSSDRLQFSSFQGSSYSSGGNLVTERVFRDVSAWYHIVCRWDSNNSTANNRMKIWVNGEEIGDFASRTNPSSGRESLINYQGYTTIGLMGSNYLNGCLSHVHFCDNQSYQASDFGETDTSTGEWKIKASPTVNYGTTGYFSLKDGNSLTDQSSNSNNLTLEGGTLTKTEDSPSTVFCTNNSAWKQESSRYLTHTKGNTMISGGGSVTWYQTPGTLAFNKGKFYWECKWNAGTNLTQNHAGVIDYEKTQESGLFRSKTGSVFFTNEDGGEMHIDGPATSADYGTLAQNDILGVAVDMDATTPTVKFYKNGSLHASTNAASLAGKFVTPAQMIYQSGEFQVNFGNGYFGTTAVSSAGTNASNNGIFEYDVPTGYTALSTKGLNL